jgi:PEP-CTERM motif
MYIRPFFLGAIVSLLLPAVAAADSLQFQTTRRKTNGSTLTLKGSTLSRTDGLPGENFGILNFTTHHLISRTLAGRATFGKEGGIAIAGHGRVPGGVIFRGTFSAPKTWTTIWVSAAGPNHQGAWYYSRPIAGLLSNGRPLSGTVTESSGDVADGQEFTFHVDLHSGKIVIAVPEPSTVGMLGTGLAGVAGLAGRRKLKAL